MIKNCSTCALGQMAYAADNECRKRDCVPRGEHPGWVARECHNCDSEDDRRCTGCIEGRNWHTRYEESPMHMEKERQHAKSGLSPSCLTCVSGQTPVSVGCPLGCTPFKPSDDRPGYKKRTCFNCAYMDDAALNCFKQRDCQNGSGPGWTSLTIPLMPITTTEEVGSTLLLL
jgi:hypothetical protein